MRAKVPFFARTQLFVSGGALVVAGFHLRRDVYFRSMDPASLWPGGVGHIHSEAPQSMLSELSTKARWLVAHHRDLLFGRSCQLRSQCRCSPHFVGRCLLSFLVPLCRPSWARPSSFSTCTNASVPIVSNSAPCTVDEKKTAPCTALAWMTTISPVGALPKPQPLLTNHLSTNTFTAFD